MCDLQVGFGNPGAKRSVTKAEAAKPAPLDGGDGYWRIGSMDVTCFGLRVWWRNQTLRTPSALILRKVPALRGI